MARPDPVTVLGAGPVGATLARALARSGRTVTIGIRHPQADPVRELLAQLGLGSLAATPGDAIRANHIIVAAIPGPSLPELIDAHASALAGKLIIDASNDLRAGHASGTLSALPHLAQTVPSALGYRAFNSLGWENMADPRFGDTAADLFYAGPQAVDSLATLWFALAFGQHRGRRLAFRLLTDTPSPPTASSP